MELSQHHSNTNIDKTKKATKKKQTKAQKGIKYTLTTKKTQQQPTKLKKFTNTNKTHNL